MMRILVCNDDGIDAPGLASLVEAARTLTADVWVIAPDGKRTAGSHQLTIGRPLTLEAAGERRFACSGSPADCVVAAMTWLFRDEPQPDLVLAGINDGRNVGEDVIYSGTLAIAREATFWGLPAIGISRTKGGQHDEAARDWLAAVLARLWRRRSDWAIEGHWLSLNLPARLPAELRQALIGRDKIALRADVLSSGAGGVTLQVRRGRAHTSAPGDENSLIDAGHAVITRLNWFGTTPLSTRFLAALACEDMTASHRAGRGPEGQSDVRARDSA